jgi:hypothetical protein
MSDSVSSPTRKRGMAAILRPEESRQYFAELGKKSNANRLTLTHNETRAIAEAYALLADVAARAAAKVKPSNDQPNE